MNDATPKSVARHCAADDICNRVHRPNFVKVDGFDQHTMNFGFSLSEQLERPNRDVTRGLWNFRLPNDPIIVIVDNDGWCAS